MRITLILALAVFVLLNCKEATGPAAQHNLADLCLTATDISSWQPSGTEACQAREKMTLYDGPMNGGADIYIDRGLKEYLFYSMSGTGTKSAEIYTMDMDSAAAARVMYDYAYTTELTDKVSLTGHGDSVACIGVFGGGIVHELHAHLDRFYFRLTFQGMADNTEATNTAEIFLSTYQAKLR